MDKKNRRILQYPGSKWKLANEICKLIPTHHSYIEPFFGSGAVFFTKSPSDIETINDMDNRVINLFRCIQKDPERLAYLVMTTPYARKVYDNSFNQQELEEQDEFDMALNFLIQCWMGHGFRTNGYKVGWKNDVHGRESAYALKNWTRLPDCIRGGVVERLRMAQIENQPAIKLMERFDYDDVFMYIDPPYLLSIRNNRKQYRYELSETEHEKLLSFCLRSQAKIMISGYESDMYNDYLKNWEKISFTSHTQSAKERKEIIWMNYDVAVKNECGEQMSLFV